jgi:hypothetical protein
MDPEPESPKLTSEQGGTSYGENLPKIKRGRVQSVVIYEMSESELETLERGSKSESLLNLFISAATTAASFLATLATLDLTGSPIVRTVFIVITVVGSFSSVILAVLWWRARSDRNDVVNRIRKRLER